MKLGKKHVGEGHPCYIIAEIGSNHNKSKETAYKLIDMACDAKVDAIKFQTLKGKDIPNSNIPANAYGDYEIVKGKKYWSEVLDELALPYEWHEELFAYARSKGITVCSTPESIEAVELLESLDVPFYKVASMDIKHKALLQRIGETRKPVILSSGIATVQDLMIAVDTLKESGSEQLAILHCVSDYPPRYDYMSLDMIKHYSEVFKDVIIGLSDHSEENFLDCVAVSMGARIIEKHITLDKNQSGPDHGFALDAKGLKELVSIVRKTEQAILISDELHERKLHKSDLYGRSVICITDKRSGERLEVEDIDYKRPGSGISPMEADKLIGLKLNKNILANHVLSWEDFK